MLKGDSTSLVLDLTMMASALLAGHTLSTASRADITVSASEMENYEVYDKSTIFAGLVFGCHEYHGLKQG